MLGDAKKKIQRIVDLAEQLYEKVNELTRRVEDTTEAVEDTNARIETLETELAQQRAILDALAEERGLDAEAIVGNGDDGADDDGAADEASSTTADGDGPPDGEQADA